MITNELISKTVFSKDVASFECKKSSTAM